MIITGETYLVRNKKLSFTRTPRTVLHQGVLPLGENVADRSGSWHVPLRSQPLRVLDHVGVAARELVCQSVPRKLELLHAVRWAPVERRYLGGDRRWRAGGAT